MIVLHYSTKGYRLTIKKVIHLGCFLDRMERRKYWRELSFQMSANCLVVDFVLGTLITLEFVECRDQMFTDHNPGDHSPDLRLKRNFYLHSALGA